MLSYHRDTELPKVDLLVVCSRDKATAIFDESDGIDGTKVLLILLHNFRGVCVILNDLFVGASGKEDILAIV